MNHRGPVGVCLLTPGAGDGVGKDGGWQHPDLAQLGLPQELREPAQLACVGGQQERVQHALASTRLYEQHLGFGEHANGRPRIHDDVQGVSLDYALSVSRNRGHLHTLSAALRAGLALGRLVPL